MNFKSFYLNKDTQKVYRLQNFYLWTLGDFKLYVSLPNQMIINPKY